MFKTGDDVRQDNLVLQFFKIMDRIWAAAGMDLSMVAYDVMESGFESGFIEFVNPATVITDMHKACTKRLLGPFDEKSMINYFTNHISKKDSFVYATSEAKLKEKLKYYHLTYLNSTAG